MMRNITGEARRTKFTPVIHASKIGRNAHRFVILGRSKERSDAAQTPGFHAVTLKRRDGAEFCSTASFGRGRGMDPWVSAPPCVATPKDDDAG
jgi:hypothetical protein